MRKNNFNKKNSSWGFKIQRLAKIRKNSYTSELELHKNLKRWIENTVDIVRRGQEFVAKPKNNKECKKWLIFIFETIVV